jgi:hypothetical protein
VGGIGTVPAFGATSLAIWQGHRLRRLERREATYDEAMKVTAVATQGFKTLGTTQSMLRITVSNEARREIRNVMVNVTAMDGQHVGDGSIEHLQAGFNTQLQFEPTDGIWGSVSEPGIRAVVRLSFEDIDGTRWKREPDGHLSRTRRRRLWGTKIEGRCDQVVTTRPSDAEKSFSD